VAGQRQHFKIEARRRRLNPRHPKQTLLTDTWPPRYECPLDEFDLKTLCTSKWKTLAKRNHRYPRGPNLVCFDLCMNRTLTSQVSDPEDPSTIRETEVLGFHVLQPRNNRSHSKLHQSVTKAPPKSQKLLGRRGLDAAERNAIY
jgi:hypothetical protein